MPERCLPSRCCCCRRTPTRLGPSSAASSCRTSTWRRPSRRARRRRSATSPRRCARWSFTRRFSRRYRQLLHRDAAGRAEPRSPSRCWSRSERWGGRPRASAIKVTEAEVVLVAVGPDGQPTPVLPRATDDRRVCSRLGVQRRLRVRRARLCPRRHPATSSLPSRGRRRASRSPPSTATAAGCRATRRETRPAPRRWRCCSASATRAGCALTIHKGLPLASGIGSSGASAVAAVVATNELLGPPGPARTCCSNARWPASMAGCGAAHPDNVAPSLYGGFVLARSAQPPDIVALPVPDGLSCAVLHPHLEIETGAARALLGDSVPLRDAVRQWGNVGALVAGAVHATIWRCIVALARRSRRRARSAPQLVPGFCDGARRPRSRPARSAAACQDPARRCLRSARRWTSRETAGEAMRAAFAPRASVGADLWVSPVGPPGRAASSACA